MSSTETGIIEDIVNGVAAWIGELITRIGDSIASFFGPIVATLQDQMLRIFDGLQRAVQQIADQILNIWDTITDFIEVAIEKVIQFVDEILTDIINKLQSAIEAAIRAIEETVDKVVGFVKDFVADAAQWLSDLFDTVVENIMSFVDVVTQRIKDVFANVVDAIGGIVERVSNYFSGLVSTVTQLVSDVIGGAASVVKSITNAIRDFIARVVDVVGESLRDLLETISGLPTVISELSDAIIQSARENIADPLTALPVSLITNIVERITGVQVEENERMEIGTLEMVFGASPTARSPEEFRQFFERFMPQNVVIRGIIMALVSPLIIMQTLSGVAQANSQIILQEHALENPYRLIDPLDVVRALHFDKISDDFALGQLQRTGYTKDDARTLLDIGELVPPEGELISWWLRGITNEGNLQKQLGNKGWSDENIANIKEAAFFVPPVQDLITMAVREAFSPEIARRFGQFEDFPEDFAKFAKQQGISDEWAERYWAAHWALPSVQMGFEMLHRGVIELPDLELLMRASDIMPFWRDKIIDISFNPFTRVDIRRMHKLEILDRAGVMRAYLDIGYNNEKAEQLTNFTEALNTPESADDPTDLSNLSRSNILSFYADGIIDRKTANGLLADSGYSALAAKLYLDGIDLDAERAERRAQIQAIIDQAVAGLLTMDEAEDALNKLELQTTETQKALANLVRRLAAKTKLPSKADMDKFIKKKLVSDKEYIDTLERIGYAKAWADKFLKLAKG